MEYGRATERHDDLFLGGWGLGNRLAPSVLELMWTQIHVIIIESINIYNYGVTRLGVSKANCHTSWLGRTQSRIMFQWCVIHWKWDYSKLHLPLNVDSDCKIKIILLPWNGFDLINLVFLLLFIYFLIFIHFFLFFFGLLSCLNWKMHHSIVDYLGHTPDIDRT